jgi:hypothetical protein
VAQAPSAAIHSIIAPGLRPPVRTIVYHFTVLGGIFEGTWIAKVGVVSRGVGIFQGVVESIGIYNGMI